MTPAACTEPPCLVGNHVKLVPLSAGDHDALVDAARDGDLWNLWYTNVPGPAEMAAEIERRRHLQVVGTMLPFTVIDPLSCRIVGMTSFMNIDPAAPRVEIGSTWYAASVQRSGLNTEAKLLLLDHAFNAMGCIAVEFRTHFLNHQSRRAIERLGAKLDGILRHHQRTKTGMIRDTCVYSIIAPDWPAIRAHLVWQLERPRTRPFGALHTA